MKHRARKLSVLAAVYPLAHWAGFVLWVPAGPAMGAAVLVWPSSASPVSVRSDEPAKTTVEAQLQIGEPSDSALLRAVRRGDLVQVANELAKPEADPNKPNDLGERALDLALRADKPQPELIRLLIRHGALPHKVAPWNVVAPGLLHVPAPMRKESLQVVRLLVEGGAEPFQPLPGTWVAATPFAAAVGAYENEVGREIFDYLLGTGKLPPHSALASQFADYAAVDHPAAFEALLAYGARPSIDRKGRPRGTREYPEQGRWPVAAVSGADD